jgi:hypothetical protein
VARAGPGEAQTVLGRHAGRGGVGSRAW